MVYKVFRQMSDFTFVEVAQTTNLEDAEAVYERYSSAMIADVYGSVLQTKNLISSETDAMLV